MSPAESPGVTLARILRARGRKGEVAAEILTDFPERLTRLREVWLGGAGAPRRVNLRACWLHKQQAIFHFEGCDSISDAERLVGLEVQVPLSERVELPQGRYYVTDLIGCEVWEVQERKEVEEVKEVEETEETRLSSTSSTSSASSTSLGTVRDVQFPGQETPGTPLLVVETRAGELLLPLAEEICRRIDVAARRIDVVLPEGLRELNQS